MTWKLILTILASLSFGLVSLFSIISLLYFTRIATKHYGDDLDKQTKPVKFTLIVFALSMCMRAIKFPLMYNEHVPNYMVVKSPVTVNKNDPLEAILFFCQYAVFDLMPIGLLVYLHHKSF